MSVMHFGPGSNLLLLGYLHFSASSEERNKMYNQCYKVILLITDVAKL